MKPKFLLLALGFALFAGGCATPPWKAGRPVGWEEKFRKADENADGKVSRQEFGYSMIEEAFARFDKNKNGTITLEEFVAIGGSPASFKKVDRNGNGVITLEEAKSAKVAMDAMTVFFYEADVDKDGYVTLGEALAYRERVREYTR